MKQIIEKNPILGTNGQLMVMAAHRYCLGRQSYIVSSCIEWLTLWWPLFDKNTQSVIIRDTIEALMEESAGGDCDARGWKEFAQTHYYKLSEEDKRWCKLALSHKKEKWPLNKGESK